MANTARHTRARWRRRRERQVSGCRPRASGLGQGGRRQSEGLSLVHPVFSLPRPGCRVSSPPRCTLTPETRCSEVQPIDVANISGIPDADARTAIRVTSQSAPATTQVFTIQAWVSHGQRCHRFAATARRKACTARETARDAAEGDAGPARTSSDARPTSLAQPSGLGPEA